MTLTKTQKALRKKFENMADTFELDKAEIMPMVDNALAEGMTEESFINMMTRLAVEHLFQELKETRKHEPKGRSAAKV